MSVFPPDHGTRVALPCLSPKVDDYLPPELLRSPLEDPPPVSAIGQSQGPLSGYHSTSQKCVALLRQTLQATDALGNLWSWTQPPYLDARCKCCKCSNRTMKRVEQGSKSTSAHALTAWYHFQSVDLLFLAFCLSAMSLVRSERGCIPCFNCSSAGAQGLLLFRAGAQVPVADSQWLNLQAP